MSTRRQVPTEVIAEVCGVGRTAVFAKLNGSSAWKLREVVLLAEYFDVSVDELISGVVSVVPAAGLPPRIRRSPAGRKADGASESLSQRVRLEGLEPPTFWLVASNSRPGRVVSVPSERLTDDLAPVIHIAELRAHRAAASA